MGSTGSVDQFTRPAVASGKTSLIAGPGLSIATAGISASFTVLSKDMYGNMRDSCADIMYVRMLPDAPTCTLGDYPWDWANDANTWTTGAAGDFFTCSGKGKINLDTLDVTTMTDNVANDDNHLAIGTEDTVGVQKAVPLDTDTASTSCTKDMFTGNRHPFTYVQTRAGSATLYASEVPGGLGSSYAASVTPKPCTMSPTPCTTLPRPNLTPRSHNLNRKPYAPNHFQPPTLNAKRCTRSARG